MKYSIVFFLIVVSCSPKKSLGPLAAPGVNGFVSSELVYPLENRPTPECHASTIIETRSGLLCAFFAGTHERSPDVGIRLSRFVDGKWSFPKEITNGVENDSVRYPTWNPVLFQPVDGPLMLFYKVGPDPRSWWGMVMTSNDDGRSWSKPTKLGEDPRIGHLIGPVKNKPIQLDDGTILCPSSTEKLDGDGVIWKVHFEASRDGGKTWEVIGPINDGIEFDAIQPSILRYADGRLQVLCRTEQNVIGASWSEDQGRTWSPMKATSLPNPNAGTDAVTLRDGRQLLAYNHTTDAGPEPKDRNMLNLAISDDGVHWKPFLVLENVPVQSGYAYPAIIQTSDGMVHVSYTYNRQSIKHVVLDPERIR